MRKNNRGLYVCIEGLDGSGKTTLVETLKKMFIDKNVEVDTISPTKLSDKNHLTEKIFYKSKFLNNNRFLRSILYAHRSNYAAKKVDWGKTLIIGDRSIVISYVIRWGKSMFKKFICKNMVNTMEHRIFAPDHVIFLDAPFDVLKTRIDNRKKVRDIDETDQRLYEMKDAYDEIMSKNVIRRLKNVRWHIISAIDSQNEVANNAFNLISKLLEE